MSPAGIPMFYGAADVDTAIKETAAHTDRPYVTAAAFATDRPCTVVDFTDLPPVPSMFDPDRGHARRPLLFLHEFVKQLSKPTRSSAHDQIDYVPTQIVTEYLLRIFGNGKLVIGLAYPSTLTKTPCVVLDVPNERCVDPTGFPGSDGLTLRLVADSIRTDRLPGP